METKKHEESATVTTHSAERPGLFRRASDGAVEFAQNRPVTSAFIAMGAYDVGKAALRGPVTKGARFVSEKVGGLIGRKVAQTTVGVTAEQTAHLIGGLVKSIF